MVRKDSNNDGLLDSTDVGLPGVTVALYTDPNGDGDPSDGEQASLVVTDSSGHFQFDNVLPGTYVVVETDPDKHGSVLDSAGGNDNRIPLALVAGQVPTNLVFLDVEPVDDLMGTVYNDVDGDGDPKDPDVGLPGVTLELWSDPNGDGNRDDGVLTATMQTDENGNYSFPEVTGGNWIVIQNNKPAFVSTGDASGTNDDRIVLTIDVVDGKTHCTKSQFKALSSDSCAGLFFMDRPLSSLIGLSKTAYQGHDNGAKCGTDAAVDALTLVDLDKKQPGSCDLLF